MHRKGIEALVFVDAKRAIVRLALQIARRLDAGLHQVAYYLSERNDRPDSLGIVD